MKLQTERAALQGALSDAADAGATHQEIANVVSLTRQRVSQILKNEDEA